MVQLVDLTSDRRHTLLRPKRQQAHHATTPQPPQSSPSKILFSCQVTYHAPAGLRRLPLLREAEGRQGAARACSLVVVVVVGMHEVDE